MYKDHNEFYDDVRKLIADLKTNGLDDFGRQLDDAMYGSTGSEIFGDLRGALMRLLERTDCPDPERDLANQIIEANQSVLEYSSVT